MGVQRGEKMGHALLLFLEIKRGASLGMTINTEIPISILRFMDRLLRK